MPEFPKYEGWPKGVNTLMRDHSLPLDTLRRSFNYDIDDVGKLSTRPGQNRIYAGTITPDTLWTNLAKDKTFFVEAGALMRLIQRVDLTYSAQLVRTGVGTRPMRYVEVNDQVYYTNGVITGRLGTDNESLPWGIHGPSDQPNVAVAESGELGAGCYQVAVTFMSADGEESGTPLAVKVEAANDGSSLILTDIPQPVDSSWIILVYVSNRDGAGLYYHGLAIPGASSYEIDRVDLTLRLLQTQHGVKPPAGQAIEYHNGRILIAAGNILWLTEPMRYGLVKPLTGFLWYPKPITMVKAVADGFFIASDKTYWVTGTDTANIRQKEILPYGAVLGTGIDIPNFDAVAWWSNKGLVVAGLNGEAINVTEDSIHAAPFDSGSMMWREFEGIRSIVSSLRSGTQSVFAAADYVSLETARAGHAI